MSDYESKPPSIGLWKAERGPVATGNCGGISYIIQPTIYCFCSRIVSTQNNFKINILVRKVISV